MGISANRKLDTVGAPDLRGIETRSGRAVWDDKGNSTWEWQTQPGVFTRDVDTVQLKALLGQDLSIEDYESPAETAFRR